MSLGQNLVLAQPGFRHRVYLREGFRRNTMASCWKRICHQFTFPDFKSGRYDAFLNAVRDTHMHKFEHRKSWSSRFSVNLHHKRELQLSNAPAAHPAGFKSVPAIVEIGDARKRPSRGQHIFLRSARVQFFVIVIAG